LRGIIIVAHDQLGILCRIPLLIAVTGFLTCGFKENAKQMFMSLRDWGISSTGGMNMLHQETKSEQNKTPEFKKDFYIQQLLRIGVYKSFGKQLYELSMDELQDVYLEYYVGGDIAQ
jgi:Fur-regulated basic protein A